MGIKQMEGKHVGGYDVWVAKDGQSLELGDADSDE